MVIEANSDFFLKVWEGTIKGGQAVLLFSVDFTLEQKGQVGTGTLIQHLWHEKDMHTSWYKASEQVICLQGGRRWGADYPRVSIKVRNLWVLINSTGHTALHVY